MALGPQWGPFRDKFKFGVKFAITKKIIKRLVLSNLAKIYDPLRELSPVTIVGKLTL